jgi:hypothetical protein
MAQQLRERVDKWDYMELKSFCTTKEMVSKLKTPLIEQEKIFVVTYQKTDNQTIQGALYTMEFYAAIKKNEMLSFAGKWMELENIILSEVSLAQKTKNRMFSLICGH